MESLDINPKLLDALRKAKLNDFGTILSLSTPDLCRRTQLSYNDTNTIKKAVVSAVISARAFTGLEMYKKECGDAFIINRLTTGCPIIDAFLRGGLLCRGITEIAGESASGKTQLCIQLCLTAQLPTNMGGLGAGAVYLCTEDVFPNRRLVQMVNLLKRRSSDPLIKKLAFLDNIYIEHAAELDDMWNCINKKMPVLLERKQVKLIVIDSIAALFRCELETGGVIHRAKQLSKLAARLHELSNRYHAPVICVNQVSGVVNSESNNGPKQRNITPALGLSWANLVTCRFMLQRTERHVTIKDQHYSDSKLKSYEANVRSMEVMFAPHLANSICHFIVDTEGVKGIS